MQCRIIPKQSLFEFYVHLPLIRVKFELSNRFSLELGGDAPVLIFADTKDLKGAIEDVVGLKFANGGQICVSPNRVFVQKEIYPMVLEECKKLAAKYAYGTGDDHLPKEEVLQPVVSAQALEK